MLEKFKHTILKATGASAFSLIEEIQELWSGYGKILRVELDNSMIKTAIIKHVNIPNAKNHPRGWNTNISHKRKLKSYQVEMAWYRDYAMHHSNNMPRIANCYALDQVGSEVLFILEDQDAAGYEKRLHNADWQEAALCIQWLAQFHAKWLKREPENLWKNGTYWDLDTRPDELKALDDDKLRKAASKIDLTLKQVQFSTLVHGDAKLANFCFSNSCDKVSAVDFQYVGGGCGMKDLAYFIGSCFNEKECEQLEVQTLDTYFQHFKEATSLNEDEFFSLEKEWRSLYRVAWADFHRFLKGWSPSHWKINTYSEKVTKEIIETIS